MFDTKLINLSEKEVKKLSPQEKNLWATHMTGNFYSKKYPVDFDSENIELVINKKKIKVFANISDSDVVLFRKDDLQDKDIIIVVKYGKNAHNYNSKVISVKDALEHSDKHPKSPGFNISECKQSEKWLRE